MVFFYHDVTAPSEPWPSHYEGYIGHIQLDTLESV